MILIVLISQSPAAANLDLGLGISYLPFNKTEIKYNYDFQIYYRFLKIWKAEIELNKNETEIIWSLPVVAVVNYPLLDYPGQEDLNKLKVSGCFNIGASWTKLGLRYPGYPDDIYYIKYVGWRLYTDLGLNLFYGNKYNGFYIIPGFRYISPYEIKSYRIAGNDVNYNIISPFIIIGGSVGI